MIVGVFLRNYKCYSNINFIPFLKHMDENLNIFIGKNGIGKSSILEGLDCVLNEVEPRTWETTIGQKKDRTFICPIFLIKKTVFQPTPEQTALSDAFWNTDFKTLSSSESVQQFIVWRDGLKDKIEHNDYLLYCIGKNATNDVLLTSTFHQKLFDQTKRFGVSKQKIIDLFHKVISKYTYIYIPIENRISDVLSLQAKEMQGLMDKSVSTEIKKLLSDKNYTNDSDGKKKSIVDHINSNLDEYIKEINSKMSCGYSFEAKGTNKKTVKPNDILQAILREYFSIRPLTKDGKHIKSLSSGQQRLALIDVASTLLSSNEEKNRNIVLAIDEPESSLEAANRFDQFSRLVDIAESHGHQILLTTHWYGLLLRPTVGRLNFIYKDESVPIIKSYPLKKLFDERRHFPNSIEMKSYFDLMSSMLSLLKNSSTNWLICEGYEDALYLNLYLKDKLQNTQILPFNGCGNIKKLFKFLDVPFSEKTENSQIKGKVLCLIDTDEKSLITVPGYKAQNYKNKLAFNRLLLNREKDESQLISVADTNASNTEIEDVLSPAIMWNALKEIAKNDETLKKYLNGFKLVNESRHTDLTKNATFLKKQSLDAHDTFEDFKKYIATDMLKQKIANTYYKLGKKEESLELLPWMDNIVSYFNN